MKTEVNKTEIRGEIKTKEDCLFCTSYTLRHRFEELFIYFWVFSGAGHYMEVLLSIANLTGGWRPKMMTSTPIAPPYGFGAVASILFVMPLKEKFKLNLPIVFLLNMIVMMVVEFVCGLGVVLVVGYNPYWNYTGQWGNVMGLTSVPNGFFFGILATIFVYFAYPISEKFLKRLGKKKVEWVFWVLFITYGIDLVYAYIISGRVLK